MQNLKVLLLAANSEEKNLRLNAEQRDIQERVELSEWQLQKQNRDVPLPRIEFIPLSATRVRDLSRSLRLHQPQVLHFSGHGVASGELIFETQTGRRAPVPPEVLASILSPFRQMLRVVLLNACYSQLQAAGIVECIDCCIGMSTAIEDSAALVFAQAFYELAALGSSIGEAFHLACQELATLEDGRNLCRVPRILSRSGVDTNRVFLTSPPAAPPALTAKNTLELPPAEALSSSSLPPALSQLAALPARQLSTSQLRRHIDEALLGDAEVNAFLQSKYPRSARQISDNMQRTTKLNILFTYEPDMLRLRSKLIEFCTEQDAQFPAVPPRSP